MFSRVLPKSLPQSVVAPWRAVLTVWANIPRLSVDPFVLDSRSFAPFRFRHDLARRPVPLLEKTLKGHDADLLPRIPFTEDYLRCLRLNLILIEQTVAQIEFIDDNFEERCRRNGQNCSC